MLHLRATSELEPDDAFTIVADEQSFIPLEKLDIHERHALRHELSQALNAFNCIVTHRSQISLIIVPQPPIPSQPAQLASHIEISLMSTDYLAIVQSPESARGINFLFPANIRAEEMREHCRQHQQEQTTARIASMVR